MRLFKSKYLKIVFIIAAAFIVSDFSMKNIFLANSPKINPNASQNMLAKVNGLWSKTTSFLAFTRFGSGNSLPTTGMIKDLPKATLDALNAPLSKISQGVYAGERNNTVVHEIRMNEIDYLEYTFTVNGKPVTFRIPKDQQPPTQEQLNELFK